MFAIVVFNKRRKIVATITIATFINDKTFVAIIQRVQKNLLNSRFRKNIVSIILILKNFVKNNSQTNKLRNVNNEKKQNQKKLSIFFKKKIIVYRRNIVLNMLNMFQKIAMLLLLSILILIFNFLLLIKQ